MSVVVLNMKFIMTDIQFAPLNSILLFILNILLVNILPAEYSDEYPAGWYLVFVNPVQFIIVSQKTMRITYSGKQTTSIARLILTVMPQLLSRRVHSEFFRGQKRKEICDTLVCSVMVIVKW